jgi:hypothetical protein
MRLMRRESYHFFKAYQCRNFTVYRASHTSSNFITLEARLLIDVNVIFLKLTEHA